MENKKMNNIKSKNVVKMLAVLLMLSFVASMAVVPKANAVQTVPFVDPLPKTVGVGQYTLINFGLLNVLLNSKDGWNVTLVITDPDGKVEKIDRMTWSTGTVGYGYTPTKVGNYTLQCVFQNVTYGTTNANRKMYESSESENVTLRVLEDFYAPYHPGHSMPTSYWTRPVDSQLREWYSIMGSWLERPRDLYARNQGDAPESAHILWNMPLNDGTGAGLAGGANDYGHETGDAYEGKWSGSLIIDGVLMYNKYYSSTGTLANKQTIVGVDLHTGKVLWENNYPGTTSRLSRGQTLSFWSVNNRAVWSYAWIVSGSNWWGVEPRSGVLIFNMTGVPSGTLSYGPNGEILQYTWVNFGTTAAPNYGLRQWNSTRAVLQDIDPLTGTGYAWGSRTVGQSRNVTLGGFDRNITVSGLSTRNMGNPNMVYPMDRAVWYSASETLVSLTGVSLDAESGEGSVLFNNRTWTPPKDWQELGILSSGSLAQSGWAAISGDEKVIIYWVKELRINYAFSLETGKYLWQTEPQIYADAWSDTATMSFGPERAIAYGKLFSASVGGIVYCYDIETGDKLWEYLNTQKYAPEYYLTNEWWTVIPFVADGKVYVGHMEHSALEPKPRGAPFFALDAETGDLVWEIDGAFRQTRWGGRAIIGDSIIATMDTYDQQIYAIGKGPSTMTMSTPNVAITAGTTALITGTVMDVSPGTNSDQAQLQFPNGVPVSSDETQSDWMLHVYKQFEPPTTFKGVQVSLYAWDGQSADSTLIGTVETDIYGKYTLAWTPQTAGQYQIFAFFEGSASYYPSEAKAEMYVAAAPEEVIVETPPYALYIALAAIAIIVAVVIIGLLLYMKINKR
jgi:outer membrane protein assembly factor BamB